MKVLVTFAVDAEFAPWLKLRRFARREVRTCNPSMDFCYTTRIGDTQVDVYLTGMGWKAVKAGLHALFAESPDICISSGFTGGLNPSLRSGDIVAARRVSNVSGGGLVSCNRKLVKAAEECGVRIVDTSLTYPHIVSLAQFKRAMAKFGDTIEMESYHILAMSTGPQVPAVMIRTVSDTVNEDLPLDFSRVIKDDGRVSARQLALQLCRFPHRIPALLRFGRRSQRAARRLVGFLDSYISYLAKNPGQWTSGILEEVSAT